MGKSHQAGWVVLRGKKWYGYFRRRVLDLQTERERADTVCIQLGLKPQMTKFEARETLRAEINKQTGQNPNERPRKDGSVSFGWFVRNRYLPLREGDWRPETAKIKKIQIEQDLLAKFEEVPLEMLDKFMLQTHLNNLATRLSQDRVKHARSYLKSIFDEAIDQQFLVSDPARKLKVPNHLRSKNKQVLTWEQMREALAKTSKRDLHPRNRAIVQKLLVTIAYAAGARVPFRFDPEPVHVRSNPCFAIPPQLVIRAIRATFKLLQQRMLENSFIHNRSL